MGVQSFGNPAASFRGRFGRTGKRAANPVILSTILSVTKPDTTTTTVDLATADFNFAVAGPYTVTISNPASVLLKTWGAGGRNDYITVDSGGGGYAEGTMTLQSGTTYYVVVGSGGGTAPTYAPGNAPVPYGGGGAHNNPVGGGPGGGFSGLFISSVAQANSILIAGGGGGCYGNGSGGGGGGTTGQNGGGYTAPAGGGGGTQSAGGAGGIGGGNNGTAGSALTGGKGGTGPGSSGGGGGYYGGGGGGGGTGAGDYGAGGGGSGYTNPTYISSPVLTQATSYLAANNSNPDRQNAGNGASATPANGQPGRFIIRKL